MFILPVVYWCIDAGLGIRIAVILLFSDAVHGIAKLALAGLHLIERRIKPLEPPKSVA